MDAIPLGVLFGLLALLLLLSAFFSGTETALMSLNRYRLRHRARAGHRGARLAEKLLARPDRLIGLILLGNNAANIAAASTMTLICLRIGTQQALILGPILLLLVTLVFAEVAPKTLAALRPERLAMPASFVYYPLLTVLYPAVWFVNLLANAVLSLIGQRPVGRTSDALSQEELRTVVTEAGALLPRRNRDMLMRILDLESVTVDDVMIPRNEILGLDLEKDWDDLLEDIERSQHTRLPLFRGEIQGVVGLLHLRDIVEELAGGRLDEEELVKCAREVYFVPEGTSLYQQLLHFQRLKRRMAFVVDEYGDVQGLVTVDDILEEIVGEFTTDPADVYQDVQTDAEGRYLITGSANVRELNRLLRWNLPTDGPKTLNGLILEALEQIPPTGTRVQVRGYDMDILQTADNAVRMVRVTPPTAQATPEG